MRSPRTVWIVTAVLLIALAATRWSQPTPLAYDDYGQYLSHAKALIEGRPYGDTGYLYTPYRPHVGPPLASPGLPLTIAPLLAAGVGTTLLTRILMFGGLALFLAMAGTSLRSIEPVPAAAAVLMTGTALLLAGAPTALGSDLIFAALLWAMVLIADHRGPWTAKRTVLFTLVGIGALLYRLAGVAMLPALAIYWIVHRKRTKQWILIPLTVLTALFIWQYVVVGIGNFHELPVAIEKVSGDDPSHVQQIVRNLFTYRFAVFESHLYPAPWKTVNALYHAASALIAGAGLTIWVTRSRRSLAPLLVASYVAMLLWVGAVTVRYAWPLFPVSAFGLWLGWRWLWHTRTRDPQKADYSVFVTAVAVSLFAVLSHTSLMNKRWPSVEHPQVQQLYREVRLLREREPAVRMGYFKPRSLTWLTGVPAMPLFEAPEEATLGELEANRITHVVVGGLGLYQGLFDHWNRLIADNPDVFDRVWANDGFVIYRVRPTKTGA